MDYVLLTWKTPEGKRRRSFAVKPEPREAERRTVGYCLVTDDGDGRGETLVAFTRDSSVRVRPARWNNFYGWLEVAGEGKEDSSAGDTGAVASQSLSGD